MRRGTFSTMAPGVEALPLEMLCGRARVDRSDDSRKGIAAEDLAAARSVRRRARADQDAQLALWGSPEFHQDYVGVTEAGARYPGRARRQGASASTTCRSKSSRSPARPRTTSLLGAGTIVIEGLNLRDVEPGIYEMFCLPLAIVGADGAPARVVLRQS